MRQSLYTFILKPLGACLLTVLFMMGSWTAEASHIPGANITYTCNPSNPLEYTFTFTIFRRCPGTLGTTMNSTYFTLTNDCGLTNPVVPTFNQVGVEEDVNQLCETATSNCNSGTSPGVWKYTYEATIILPADCDAWHMEFDLCCRDGAANLTGGTGNSMYTSTSLYTSTAPCNSSPYVTSVPIPYACANQPFNHCLSIADPEGDNATYRLVAPQDAGVNIAHNAGYSPTSPLQNFTFDTNTGCFSLNQSTAGQYVVAIVIESRDAMGNIISEVTHDFKIIVEVCSNSPPQNPAGGISNVTGSATQTGPTTVAACYGDNICFDVVFEDSINIGDTLDIVTDALTLLPGATFTETGTNPITGTLCWTAQPGYTGSVVTFIVEDDGCPVMGTSGFSVLFDLTTGVYAGPEVTICGSQTAQLQAYGAGSYTWTPTGSLSCSNCPNPVASPSTTTDYIVTGNLTGVCSNVDTVRVNVVPDFNITMNPAAPTICANEMVQLNASGTGAYAPYTYYWTDSSTLDKGYGNDPVAQPLVSTNYTVTMTSNAGCTKTETVPVTVSGVGPTVFISPADTVICPGTSAPLTSEAVIYPVVCGPSSGCTGPTTTAEIGTSTSATSSYHIFYGSTSTTSNYDRRVQYIYTKSELNAMGIYGGTIRDIALYINTSYTYQYDNVEIWMGCTSLDEFPGTNFQAVGSMTKVYGPVNNVNPTNAGWHVFNIADYDWDGQSNIIIQMCGQEDNTNDEGSESVRYSSTSPAYRCMHYNTTTGGACASATGYRYTNRPNMQFNFCAQTATTPTYSWSPGATLSSTNTQNTVASPTVDTDYYLDVTSNGCTGTGMATVSVTNLNVDITPAGPVNYCSGDPAVSLNSQLYEDGVAVPLGGAQPYSEGTSAPLPLCSGVTGGDHTVIFDSGVYDATGNVTLNLCMTGDFGSTTEDFTVFGEGGVNLGTFNQASAVPASSQGDCNATPFCNQITITQAQWNAWNVDGQVVFTVDVNTNVNNFCSPSGGTGGSTSSCVTSADVNYTGNLGTSYTWAPAAGLTDPNIQNPDASPGATTTYTVSSIFKGCTVTDAVTFNVGTPSTAPAMTPMPGTYCPNTTMTLTAGGGVAGTGSSIEWYTGPNGTGTWLGSGGSYAITPTTTGQTYYIRREGPCGNTADDQVTINLKDYVYGLNATSTSNYCTDNAGWNHFYVGNEIVLSVQGDLSGAPAGFPVASIWENATYYQQGQGPFPATSCTNFLTPGEERFEMERSWNLDFGGGTQVPPYNVRFYYRPHEKTDLENAAANWMATYPACGYTYKYAVPNGFYWFKNTGSNYTAPDYDGLHLTSATGATGNGTNYAEFTGVASFSGGSAAIILVPNTLLNAQWLYFDGETTDNSINNLRWATEQEVNTSHFNIQRSQDGVSFTTVGTSPAQGNATTTTHYTYDDVNPFEGANYYRLELVDADGKVSYSNTILLFINPDDVGYTFHPNPTRDVVYYSYEASKSEMLEIEVVDVLGRVLHTERTTSVAGTNNIQVSLEDYPTGAYIVRVNHVNSANVHTAKIVKKGM